ncbi:MAG TPA: phytanoyl-CoA dioxygenase family protein [Paracoccaceae bacterium]|nr:phytanoyl-CoA dioxygenase family protein [Paracoccaceae bacterium]
MLDTTSLAESYARDGFFFPIRVMSDAQAATCRAELEKAEAMVRDRDDGRRFFREYANVALGFVDEITRSPAVTDPVAAILGEDLLVMACSFFIKEPQTTAYVSWHQDLHYWGLEGDDEITAWVALSPATPDSGCMRFVAGSHRQIVDHRDTHHQDNLLTRGQEIAVEVDDADAVDVALRPGEMSLHHGRVFHTSDPNRSDDRRIGLAIRYIPARMKQMAGASLCATLVRGEDRHGHFHLVEGGTGLLTAADMARHTEVSERRNRVLMRDTSAGGGGRRG